MAAMDLDLLPLYGLFALVLRSESFSAAAKETGLTRSAVSQRIARLEAKLGVELFRRTTRRVAPTAKGLALYEAASRLLDDSRGLQLLGPWHGDERLTNLHKNNSLILKFFRARRSDACYRRFPPAVR